jgi:predicted PurR-regulated permease PerM
MTLALTRSSLPQRERISLRVVTGALLLASCVVFHQLVPWVLLAAWFATLTRPSLARLARALGGRHRAAALLTLALFVALAVPLAFLGVALYQEGSELYATLSSSRSGRAALEALVSGSGGGGRGLRWDARSLVTLLETHGAHAMDLADGLATIALGVFVFFSTAYVLLAEGGAAYVWLERTLPIANRHIARFASSFAETGRGLFVSVLVSGLVQAGVATVCYVALDVPRALTLGALTLVVSIIPSVGTALVWVPVAVGLALSGRTTEAGVLAALGVFVISAVDNLLRPVFARWGRLELHPLVVLLSMLGGLAVLGGWGVLLGPLLARWLLEALRIAREERVLGTDREESQPPLGAG